MGRGMQQWSTLGLFPLLLAALTIACSISSGEEQPPPPRVVKTRMATNFATTPQSSYAAPVSACERFIVVASAREIAIEALQTATTIGQKVVGYRDALAEITSIVPHGEEA